MESGSHSVIAGKFGRDERGELTLTLPGRQTTRESLASSSVDWFSATVPAGQPRAL
jgi:hypothetical protein